MAIGWLSLLKTVPWAQVISTAPVVADGARKLWNGVAKKSVPAPAPAPAPTAEAYAAQPGSEADAVVRARVQVAALETSVADLREQMLESSALIKALADQNTELIKRVEANRIRLLWLSLAVAALVVVGLGQVLTA